MRKSPAFGALLLFFGSVAIAGPSRADPPSCTDWTTFNTPLMNFFEVEGRHRRNLLGNYNAVPPRTRYRPDLVGYYWSPGITQARLVFVRDGCVRLEHMTSVQVIWAVMQNYPVNVPGLNKPKASP